MQQDLHYHLKGRPHCPDCGSTAVLRSHRRGRLEYLLSLVYLYPFRCVVCNHRFRAFSWHANREGQGERTARP